jgi:hypothetical protein
MERVEGLLRNLNLSEAEQKGLKILYKEGGQKEETSCKALGKVFSEKQVYAEGLENSLGGFGVRSKEYAVKVWVIILSSSPFCNVLERRKLWRKAHGW